tara:strand:+ start:238 stop:546 length:309 start_codon:yes stop_codon:yes gene_type:complete
VAKQATQKFRQYNLLNNGRYTSLFILLLYGVLINWGIEMDKDMEMAVEKNTGVADTERTLMNAERHIEKLTCELKEKEYEIQEHVRRWQFYEQIVKNLTTFK